MKIKQLTTLMLVAAVLVSLRPVLAQTATTEETKPVDESVNELLQIRDDTTLTDEEKLAKEFDSRKKILTEVVNLSLDEINKLKDKLKGLGEFKNDSQEKLLQDRFNSSLDGYITYYNDQTKKIDDLNTIDEAKALAQEIKDYRDETYNPEVQDVVNFVLVFYNDDVLKTANTRLDKISSDISKLEKLGYLRTGLFNDKLKEAKDTLTAAGDMNKEAKDAILAPTPTVETTQGDESGVTTPETIQSPTATTGTEGDIKETKPVPLTTSELIADSLNGVKSAYEIFLQIGKDLRKTLGLQ